MIEAIQQKVDRNNAKQLFDDCDAVVEAFDKVECKTMMAEAFASSGKFLYVHRDLPVGETVMK